MNPALVCERRTSHLYAVSTVCCPRGGRWVLACATDATLVAALVKARLG